MKRIQLFFGMLSLLAVVSCKQKEEVPVAVPVPVETTADELPLPPPPPKEDTVSSGGTSVSVGKEGVDVTTKTTTKKTAVSINKDGAAVEIKK